MAPVRNHSHPNRRDREFGLGINIIPLPGRMLVLHGDSLRPVTPATVPDWKQFVRDLPDADREWLEYQAYAFAGLVLVPREPLLREYRAAVRRADEAGINLEQFPDVAKSYMATSIARAFEVSAAVIEKRLAKDTV